MLRLVAKFFDMKMYQLFPLGLLAKILIPSSLALIAIKYGLGQFLLSELLILIIGGLLFFIFYMLLAVVFRLNYMKLLQPLLAKVIK